MMVPPEATVPSAMISVAVAHPTPPPAVHDVQEGTTKPTIAKSTSSNLSENRG